MEIISTNNFNGFKLNVYGTIDKPIFKAKEVGKILGLKNIRENLQDVPDRLKLTVRETYSDGKTHPVSYIREPALYRITFRSNKKIAQNFVNWITEEVLPSIRKTGSYELKPQHIRVNHQMYITNEASLQKEVISFLRTKKDVLSLKWIVPLGELQDTQEKRIEAYRMGYEKGQPDIILNNPSSKYEGLILEFKTPNGNGELSKEQIKIIKTYKNDGFKCIVSNNLCEIIEKLTKYFMKLRIRCKYCKNKFRTTKTRKNHIKYFHRITS